MDNERMLKPLPWYVTDERGWDNAYVRPGVNEKSYDFSLQLAADEVFMAPTTAEGLADPTER